MAKQTQAVAAGGQVTVGSAYIDDLRRDYSLYVMQQRAIPSEADGLKSSGRRLLWTARNGQDWKTSALAGAVAPLHPHAAPEGSVNTLAGFYINNVPLFQGAGAFGTLINPNAFGAARYTSVKLSKFTKDVMFADLDIIPMKPNYDETEMEPKHFLPLVPVSLLNPSEGIAVGFSCTILPRLLPDIVANQISYLQGKRYKEAKPGLVSIDSESTGQEDGKWVFEGTIERTAHNVVTISKVPYGTLHKNVEAKLIKLEEAQKIVSFDDESARDINIKVIFKKGDLKNYTDEELLKMFGLVTRLGENMNMVAFCGTKVVEHDYRTALEAFCDWRLDWFVARYQNKKLQLEKELQYTCDILIAIRSGIMAKLTTTASKAVLEAALGKAGVQDTGRIAGLPSYRFTQEEVAKQLEEERRLRGEIADCVKLLKSEPLRREQYILELQAIQAAAKKGSYNITM